MVESGCTASKVVKAGDILVKVNATEVFDRDVARKMIMESINASKRVTLTLERCLFAPLPPLIPKPQGSVPGAPPQPEPPKPPLDVVLPADVVGILEANKNFFRAPCSLPPCLKKVPQSRETLAHLNMPPSPTTETTIPYDPSPKPLKATPKRLGS
ncbi:hypothetical protein TELCIR_04665 [Teladorsagia circumcincta]|uniref:PDZ domain-containing protein n=1 Tax=Teladorsagia circumcincta TaxID=45464 RepID=A0A2G9USZ6_TELCI|nr:hypothetical protein TELCIR_04665 [Teladorsagia circumcincta]